MMMMMMMMINIQHTTCSHNIFSVPIQIVNIYKSITEY